MNLRNFIGTMLSATAGFAILPGATLWKPTPLRIVKGWDIGDSDIVCTAFYFDGEHLHPI